MWRRHGKKPNKILFQFFREISIGGERKTEFRLGLVQFSVAFDATNRGEIFRICASVDMAICAIEMTMFEVNGNLIALNKVVLSCLVRMMSSPNMSLNKVPIHQV